MALSTAAVATGNIARVQHHRASFRAFAAAAVPRCKSSRPVDASDQVILFGSCLPLYQHSLSDVSHTPWPGHMLRVRGHAAGRSPDEGWVRPSGEVRSQEASQAAGQGKIPSCLDRCSDPSNSGRSGRGMGTWRDGAGAGRRRQEQHPKDSRQRLGGQDVATVHSPLPLALHLMRTHRAPPARYQGYSPWVSNFLPPCLCRSRCCVPTALASATPP